MVIGGLISIAGILMLVGTGSDDLTTSHGGTFENTTQKLEVVVSEVTPKPKPTSGRAPRASRIRSKQTVKTAPNRPARTTPQEQFTRPTLPSLGPKLERAPSTLPKHFMVCTVNGEGPWLENIAARGRLCDLIFLDSFYKNVGKEVEGTFKKNINSFLNSRTWTLDIHAMLGVSYSMETDALLAHTEGAGLVTDTKILFQHGIIHTAVINIHRENATKEVFDVALYALRIAFETVAKFQSEAIYSVLGAAINNASMLQVLLDQMKRVFVPSMFIFITHVSHEDRALEDCRIVPPTWLSVPNGQVSYGQSLSSSCKVLAEVARAIVNITLAVSFTLSGHMYKPKGNKPEDYKLFSPCENFHGNYYVTPYELLCTPNIRFFDKVQRSEHSMFTFNTSAQRALTFESDATIKNKVCEAKSTCQGVTFGVAAYDIEYDDQPHNEQCPEFGLVGPFGRVAFLKKLNTYLSDLSSAAAFKKEECLRVELR
ncbi:uncharacterized protein LOC144141928 [Haemaphysalis longicornis]